MGILVPSETYGDNFKRSVEPMFPKIGDTWIDTSNGGVRKVYTSTGWVEVSFQFFPPSPGNRGIFGGGYGGGERNIMNYIDISTPANAQDFGDLTVGRAQLSATSNGTNNRGVFGGGYDGNFDKVTTIDYIDISTPGNAQNFGDLTVARDKLASTSNGTNNRGVIGGGYNGNHSNAIYYIDISTPANVQDFGSLIEARHSLAATSNGTNNRGVFGGGVNGNYHEETTIDYVDISSKSDAQDFGDLIEARDELSATSNGTNNRGVFGGGSNSGYKNTIDYIDISTPANAQDFGDLVVDRKQLSATSNGINNRGVFGGGYNSGDTNLIDYIDIPTPANAQDLSDLTVSNSELSATSNGLI